MKGRLSRNIVASAMLSAALVTFLIILGSRLARPTIQHAALGSLLGAVDLAACNAAASSWGWRSGELSFFAYDRSGRSANPDAPPLEDDLLEEVLTTQQSVIATTMTRSTAVFPAASDGPCALVRMGSGSIAAATGPRQLVVVVLSLLTGLLVATLGTVWMVVLPLRARIEGLAAAAQHVGDEAFTPYPVSPDALGHIAEVLSQSHTRIIETHQTLEHRNRALEDHLAGIAHDLRTPLASMQLALEAVTTESHGPLQDEARRALADAIYLSSLVENLHQATRLRHAIDVSSGVVELSELVHRIERRFAIIGRHAHIEVAANTPERDVWVSCTPAFAERAIANLVQNAIEHHNNTETGHVALTLALNDDQTQFELTVADDGPGLPQEIWASLDMETFLTEDARRRGPGLGLLITTEIARRAGWSMAYEGLEPVGLQVRLSGPIADLS
ncbi:MAG: HAMP domain-containing sensor histidine kinase [Myxococcota bacterium]